MKLLEDFVTEEEEEKLLQCITWDSSAASNLKHRKVKHYGYAFIYETSNVNKEDPLPGEFPREMEALITKLFNAGVITLKPDQVTCNQYSPGQGIPPHVDTHSAFEDEIISVSLGTIYVEFSRYNRANRNFSFNRLIFSHGVQTFRWETIIGLTT